MLKKEINKKIKFLLSIVCLLIVLSANAQSNDLLEFNQEKEKVLNAVINSVHFDSIYSFKQIYFKSNELLSKSSPLKLKRKKCKVKILDNEELGDKAYVNLADYTITKKNPNSVRVQIYSSLTRKTLNLRLDKKKKGWTIINHLIMED